MIIKSSKCALLAGMLLGTGMLAAQASSSIVTFSVDMSAQIAGATFVPGADTVSANGTFNGYGSLNLVRVGATTVYTNTANDTTDANGGKLEYKFVIDGSNWENPATAKDRAALLPSTSGASLVLPTAFFSDAGTPVANNVTFQVDVSQQIALGNFIPGTSSVEVRGSGVPNTWSGGNTLTLDPTIYRTNQFGLVTTNIYTGTFSISGSPGGAEEFKFVINNPGTIWDSPNTVNSDGNGNRYFANVAQTLPLVDFADAPFAPLANVTFRVDMSALALTGAYSNYPAYLAGSFNGWSTSATLMTNDPAANNTNIYSAVVGIGQGSPVAYKFTYQNNGTVWENVNDRQYTVPAVASTNLPAVYFNDSPLNDLLMQDTPVRFQVDMNGAVGTDAHTFSPGLDSVYINGQFANWYAWASGINPAPAPSGYQLFETPPGSGIYSNTIIIPKGTSVAFSYKYGMDFVSAGGPADDEAASGVNHYRVVRSTAFNPYPMPTDKFGNMYGEPFFSAGSTGGAKLNVGTLSAGTVPVSWLGRPGARLQVKTNLTSGSWQEIAATDGTNWSSGFNSTNGFVSQTNWPASGKAFFRLVKP